MFKYGSSNYVNRPDGIDKINYNVQIRFLPVHNLIQTKNAACLSEFDYLLF